MLPIIIERLYAENYKEEVLSGVKSVSSFSKAAASLLLTILIFTAFMMTIFSFVFSEVEVRFYQPVVERNIEKKVESIAYYFDEYISAEKEMFSQYLANPFISSYLEARPTEVEQQMRTKATGDLFSLSNGLLGIRFIDSNKRYIHFSTYSKDLISKTSEIREYVNYSDIKNELPIEKIAVKVVDKIDENASSMEGKDLFTVFYDAPIASDDKKTFSYDNGRIIFSVPFYDEMSLYRGFFVFYVDAGDFIRFLMTKKEISVDENAVLISSDDEHSPNVGFLFGLPYSASEGLKELRQTLQTAVLDKWNVSSSSFQPLNADSSDNWILFSADSSCAVKIGFIYKSSVLSIPEILKFLLLISLFVTLYLFIFLLMNLKRDRLQFIRGRIRKFQLQLILDYLDNKEKVDWNEIARKISMRKTEFSKQIENSFGRQSKKNKKIIAELLEYSWADIFKVLGISEDGQDVKSSFDEDKLKKLLEDVISKHPVQVTASEIVKAPVLRAKKSIEKPVEEIEEVEAVEEIEEAEPAEEIEEVEPAEEIEEAEAVEEIEEVEPAEEIEEAEAVEEIEEVEPAEKNEEAEAVEEIEEVEPAEETEEAETAEETEEAESAEKTEEAEPAEKNEEAEAVEEIEEAEPAEETEEAESVEKTEEAESAEEIEEAESAEETEEAESVEKTEEAETAEKKEEVEAVEKIEESETLENVDDGLHIDNKLEENALEEYEDYVYSSGLGAEPIESDIDITDNFIISKPDYSYLDKDVSDVMPVDDENTYFINEKNDMLTFVDESLDILEAADDEENTAIIQKDGIFVISDDLNFDASILDKDFKKLVDSVTMNIES